MILLKFKLLCRNVWAQLRRSRGPEPDWQDVREFCRNSEESALEEALTALMDSDMTPGFRTLGYQWLMSINMTFSDSGQRIRRYQLAAEVFRRYVKKNS